MTKRVSPLALWTSWVPLDGCLGLLAAAVAYGLSRADWSWRVALASSVLNDDNWPSYMQTIASTVVGLLGFGAVSIAIVTAMPAGQRGRHVLTSAAGELRTVVTRCLVSITTGAVVLSLGATVKPSQARVLVGVVFTFTIVFVLLRIARLWHLTVRLMEVVMLDAADAEERVHE